MANDAYPALTSDEGVFQQLIWDPMVKAGLVALLASVSWLNVWPLNYITAFVVDTGGALIFKFFSLTVDMGAICLVNAQHQEAFESASENLRIVANDKGVKSVEYKAALQVEVAGLSKFVRYGATT